MCKNGARRFNAGEREHMRRALALARAAAQKGEVPVGAVVFGDEGVVAEAANASVSECDATAHAEIRALREACKIIGNHRLPHLSLAVTLEPCAMCAGAIFQARLRSVVFAAADEKTGAFGGVVNLADEPLLNHQTSVAGGLFQKESAALLKEFFAARR